MKKSDLYEKPGKNQHAFCNDMDNEGDVRVLCNLKPNEKWMNTMLHEFGHAGYDKFIDNKNLPFIMRDPAHTFTTEAIAMIFGRFSSNSAWMKDIPHIVNITAGFANPLMHGHQFMSKHILLDHYRHRYSKVGFYFIF